METGLRQKRRRGVTLVTASRHVESGTCWFLTFCLSVGQSERGRAVNPIIPKPAFPWECLPAFKRDFLARSQLKSVNQSLSSQCEQNKLDTTCQQAGLNPVPRHQGQSTRSFSRSSVRPSARHPRRICALTSPLQKFAFPLG